MIKTCYLILIFTVWQIHVQHSFAAPCLTPEDNDHCYRPGEYCYEHRKSLKNCPEDRPYHCARNPNTGKFTEECVEAIQCPIGKEPLIEYIPEPRIECNWCQNPAFYNPNNFTWSDTYSECQEQKTMCYGESDFQCELENKTDNHTKNIRCRCNVRKGYLRAWHYDKEADPCTFEGGLTCVKADCFPEQDVLLKGYQCATKCQEGKSRSDEYSDDCILISTLAPTVNPKSETSMSTPALSNISKPAQQTTDVSSNTDTHSKSMTARTTSAPESPPGDAIDDNNDNAKYNNAEGYIIAAIAVGLPCGILIVVLILTGVYCINKKKKKKKKQHTRDLREDPEEGYPLTDTAGQNGGNEKPTTNGTPVPNVTNITKIYHRPVTHVTGKSSATVIHTKELLQQTFGGTCPNDE